MTASGGVGGARAPGARLARFAPSGSLRGRLEAPPDKSISHRAALFAALSSGRTEIDGYLDAADTLSTLAAVEALGAGVERHRTDRGLAVSVTGVGLRGARPGARIDVGNAGTLIRLIAGWLAGQPEVGAGTAEPFLLDGDASIRGRPMARVADPLREMGALIETADDGRPPLRITPASLRGIEYRMPVASAQVKSCLLIAGLTAQGPTTVVEELASRDHSERMLTSAGADLEIDRSTSLPRLGTRTKVRIEPAQELQLPSLEVPGDISSAAFPLAAALIVPGSEVRVDGVGLNPTRVGLLGVLNRMGARIEVLETGHAAGEPVGSVIARSSSLSGTLVEGAEIPLAIDELPLIALLGCFAEGETVVRDAGELRHKESDRIETVAAAIRGIGGEIETTADGFRITGSEQPRGGSVAAAGDHRIAMLGAVAGLACAGGVEVDGIDAAAVSYPGFEAAVDALVRG